MRNESQSLTTALFTASDDYGGLYFFRFLCYLISKTGNNNWLTVASIVLTMGPLFIVLINYLRSEGYHTPAILISLMIAFMGMQMPYVFSGIRNTIAVASAITAIYLLFYKKKCYFLALALCCIAVSTHQMIFVLMPSVAVGFINKHQFKMRAIALCSMPIIFAVAEFMLRMPIDFLQQLAGRIAHYSDRAYGADRPEMIANILVFLAIALSHWLLGQEGVFANDTRLQKSYWNSYCFLGCMMIGCAVRRDFTLRIGYIMGIAAVPILCRIFYGMKCWRWKNNNYKVLVLMLVCGIMICCAKVYYDCWFTMSKWDFSIVNQ